ncbi:MAG: leader peptidase (prepilin peptidase)/N-methyltransferase [Acidimicrobiales bacterium]
MRYNSGMLQLLTLLPIWYQYTFVFILGLIIGSFLNVVIYRFHTGKSLSGHSHCLSCGHTLRWYELFPLCSYVFLLGKCKSCGCKIPVRYFLVEFSTALLFLLLYIQLPMGMLLWFSMALITVLMIITVYDMYHMIIPNELVLVTSACALLYFGLFYYQSWSFTALLMHSLAAFGAFLFYGGLWFVSKGRWIGFGDAKLAIPLGFIVGTPAVFSMVIFSFWIGAGISLCIIWFPYMVHIIRVVLQRIKNLYLRCTHCPQTPVVNYSKSLTMKSEVPFAPFMIAAFLLVYVYQVDVLVFMASIL